MTDREIIRLLQAGDAGGRIAMSGKYSAYCRNAAFNILGDSVAACSCAEKAMELACADAVLSGFLSPPPRGARNLNLFLKNATRKEALSRAAAVFGAGMPYDRVFPLISEALHGLAVTDRVLFAGKYHYGAGESFLAHALDMKPSAVPGALRRIKRAVRKHLKACLPGNNAIFVTDEVLSVYANNITPDVLAEAAVLGLRERNAAGEPSAAVE